jgi:hypothetical protein
MMVDISVNHIRHERTHTLAKELEGGGSSFVELLNDITATKRAGGSVSILPELYTLQAVCNRTGKG